MWSGGKLTPAEQTRLTGLRDDISDQQAENEALNAELQDLSQELQDVNSDKARAESWLQQMKGSLEGAIKSVDQYHHEIQDLKDQLKIQEANVARMFDLAHFYKQKEIDDTIDQMQTSALELQCEQRNAPLEILRLIHASTLHDAKSKLSTGAVSASMAFNPPKYAKIREAVDINSEDAFAKANSEKRGLEAQVARVSRMEADPFYNNQLSKAKGDYDGASSDARKQRKSESRIMRAYRELRTDVHKANEILRGLNSDYNVLVDKANEGQGQQQAQATSNPGNPSGPSVSRGPGPAPTPTQPTAPAAPPTPTNAQSLLAAERYAMINPFGSSTDYEALSDAQIIALAEMSEAEFQALLESSQPQP